MTVKVIGNIIALFGCVLMVAIGFIKKKEHMLAAQCGQFGLQSVANWMLGSASGCISGVVGVVRILVFTRVKVTVWLKLGFILLQALLTWWAGADNIIQWLPMLSMVAYTWYLDTENPIVFKIVNLAGVLMWLIHDVFYQNYVGVCFDVLSVVSTSIGIGLLIRDGVRKKKEKK